MKTDKICKNCARYTQYFRAGAFGFWEEQIGLCVEFEKTVEETGGCENWQRAEDDSAVTVQTIDRAIEHVRIILRYFTGKA